MTASFLESHRILERGPRGLTRAVERLLLHLGYEDVRVVDGGGDEGADILAVRGHRQWVLQSKWSKRGPVDKAGVNDLERARGVYAADESVLVTNTDLSIGGLRRAQELATIGIKVRVWNGATLRAIGQQMSNEPQSGVVLRTYQEEAARRIVDDLETSRRGLLVLATGLGKTVVGGEVIRSVLVKKPAAKILVVAHMKGLVDQLERALWKHLDKRVQTQSIHSDSRIDECDGVTVATVDAALRLVLTGYIPDLIMIDETHHVGEEGNYSRLLDACETAPFFGVTATPWRGDAFDITTRFGPASYKLGIAEGLQLGYLAQVDYSLFVDNLDWDVVRELSEHNYTLKELNRVLFLPQRDGEILDHLRKAWRGVFRPRCIVFCQSMDHAERFAAALRASDPSWVNATYLHSGLSRQKRQIILNAFRIGRIPILTCVDVFNEGVDVPDVNLILFLRVTHSRRIFIQQLGRGLRLSPDKTRLRVLDFVTDIRRVAAGLELQRSLAAAAGDKEVLTLGEVSNIQFSDTNAGSLLDAWIQDAASLETAADEVQLNFPEGPGLE